MVNQDNLIFTVLSPTSSLARYLDLVRNMGPRYVGYRLWHELRRRTGWLAREFPSSPPVRKFIGLEEWRRAAPPFFFSSREDLQVPQQPIPELAKRAERIRGGEIQFFGSVWKYIDPERGWLTNPTTHYTYDSTTHWTQIADLSETSGDIKYVWEKGRFTFLYDLIRYDYHHGVDQGDFVFAEIDNWLDATPINCGPHYRCSQEISLRVLNWAFALYYYRYHPALTEARWQRLLHAIYWQLRHVRSNIHFSRLTVRNNHAVTETLMLYVAGLLFPFLPEAAAWKRVGRRWLEQEVAYQIYSDGTFLQFSTNYHRVVVQLLTWAIGLTHAQGARLSSVVYKRAAASVDFLRHCQAGTGGELPNYGNNDGALFFPLTECQFRDFRPQLNALHYALTGSHLYGPGAWREEADWLLGYTTLAQVASPPPATYVHAYERGGYYLLRTVDHLAFVRCGSHRDRPYQADNLHLDLWHKGKNLLRDAGTLRYNTDEATLRYFQGTAGHNTVQLGDHDQMLKGSRFIWHYWSQADYGRVTTTPAYQEFSGQIRAYRQLAPDIRQRRQLRQWYAQPRWQVIDSFLNRPAHLPMIQRWHGPADLLDQLRFTATDAAGQALTPVVQAARYAPVYGTEEAGVEVLFVTYTDVIDTVIELLDNSKDQAATHPS